MSFVSCRPGLKDRNSTPKALLSSVDGAIAQASPAQLLGAVSLCYRASLATPSILQALDQELVKRWVCSKQLSGSACWLIW